MKRFDQMTHRQRMESIRSDVEEVRAMKQPDQPMPEPWVYLEYLLAYTEGMTARQQEWSEAVANTLNAGRVLR